VFAVSLGCHRFRVYGVVFTITITSQFIKVKYCLNMIVVAIIQSNPFNDTNQ